MIDDFVGRLLLLLEEKGLREDTIIIFISDHGENLGAHGLWQKMVAFEESIRVPLIISAPNSPPGRSTTPASLVDVAPTLSALCHLRKDPDWPGRNRFHEPDELESSPAQSAMHQPIGDWMKVTDWRMIKKDNIKYVWHRGMEEELFDLEIDPGEIRNVAGDPAYAVHLKAARAELGGFLELTNDPILEHWFIGPE